MAVWIRQFLSTAASQATGCAGRRGFYGKTLGGCHRGGQTVGAAAGYVGKIQDEGYLRAAVEEAGGAEIAYHGFLAPAELQRQYAGARAMLVTPHWIEAFGNTVIESMACGTPVVAVNRGGPAEIIEHGRSGILVPQGDVDGWSKACKRRCSLTGG